MIDKEDYRLVYLYLEFSGTIYNFDGLWIYQENTKQIRSPRNQEQYLTSCLAIEKKVKNIKNRKKLLYLEIEKRCSWHYPIPCDAKSKQIEFN